MAKLTQNHPFVFFSGYVVAVVISYIFGFLDPILLYRGEDGFLTGGQPWVLACMGGVLPNFFCSLCTALYVRF